MFAKIASSPSLLATFGLVLLPIAAVAQPTTPHLVVYTPHSAAESLANSGTARANMPLVSSKQLPMAALQSNNALPSGAYALLPGVFPNNSDATAGKGAQLDAYGNFSPQSIAPYTTTRASASIRGDSQSAAAVGVTSYPWRATGKLTFHIGSLLYGCSASLIAPGLLVTAAHCLFEYGAKSDAGYHTDYRFTPGQFDDPALVNPPYGVFTATVEVVMPVYINGADSCYLPGNVGCTNDIGLLTLAPNANGQLPGDIVGYYGYGWNGYSFTPSFGGASLASITQLGYPLAFDLGTMMERNDGVGSFWSPDGVVKQIVLGSAMTGGSSGGPWLVNFGAVPTVDSSASLGNFARSQTVVGVTSWGYTAVGENTQGASWFGQNTHSPNATNLDNRGVDRGAGNIGELVAAMCSYNPSAC